MRYRHSCLAPVVSLVVLTTSLAVAIADESVSGGVTTDDYIWDKERNGFQVGARLLSSSPNLDEGDPVVLQMVLKNTSKAEQTVVIQQYDNTYPAMGADNQISVNILGSSQRRHQHVIGPGQILEKAQYRVVVSTEGLLPGRYSATVGPAFWTTVSGQPNRGTGLGRRISIPFVIGDPSDTKLSEIPASSNDAEKIFWGSPVGGLVVGMRLPNGYHAWSTESLIEGEMYLRNLTARSIELEYEVPGAVDWNMNVTKADGGYVQLDSVFYSGYRPRVVRKLILQPSQQRRIFFNGPKAADDVSEIHGPQLQLLREKTKFEPGDPRRLIATSGEYKWTASVSVKQPDVKDLTMIISSAPVPFKVTDE